MEAVELLTLDDIVGAGTGLVYSTEPRRAQGLDGEDYFVKGPDREIVFAELAGCLLATAVGLPVAPVAACSLGGQQYAGSRRVADIGRAVAPWLRPGRVSNFETLYSCIVVDAWLANTDRNLGNVLGRSSGKGTAELVMIDFEKSATLRPFPRTRTPTIAPAQLWPTNELGRLLRNHRPMHPPTQPMQRILELAETQDAIKGIVDSVLQRIGPIDWSDDSVATLVWRGTRIEKIGNEVWASA
jgi:hypothetical protein